MNQPPPDPAISLTDLRQEATHCTACPLWRNATQTVFGEGDPHARLMLVGEQPGDQEDHSGKPFVGPAGRLLNQALEEAGIARATLYVTNAVKHFKWELRGKRRIHKTPAQREIEACHPWLAGEVTAVAPALIVCLGATASRAVLGESVTLKEARGRILHRKNAPPVLVTVHPSYLLRLHGDDRAQAYRMFIKDLKTAAALAKLNSDTPLPP